MRVQLISNFAKVEKKVSEAVPPAVFEACTILRNEWARTLAGTRHGQLYRIPGSSAPGFSLSRYRAARGRGRMLTGYYRASAPGEAPASATGRLRQSLRIAPRTTPASTECRVGSPLDYALWLEYGTKYMQPRAHLSRAYAKVKPRLIRVIGSGIRKGLR